MNPLPFSASASWTAGPMSLLRIARLRLFLPQGDIIAVEGRANVDTTALGARSVGWVGCAQRRWPVYCLSEELSLLFQVPAGRRACVLLAHGDGYLGVLCDEISTSQLTPSSIHAIPDAMKLPETPVLGMTTMDSGVACVSDGSGLAAHIERMVTR